MIKNLPENHPKNYENSVIYDWLGFSSKKHTKDDVIILLGLQDVLKDAWFNTYGFYGYKERINFDGINIMWGGQNEGVFVELSGQGCRAFEEYGNGDYDYIFNLIKQNYSHNKNDRSMKLTRLDVAYDDFNDILDIDTIIANSIEPPFGKGENYVTRFKSDDWRNPIQVILNKGKSIEYGSMKSNTFFRIYDKRIERHAAEIDHWIRFEIQLRDIKAMAFIEDPGDIREKYFQVVNEFIEYKKPNPGDTHKDRWKTAPFWKKFIENGGKIARFQKPGTEYNRDRLQKYVYEMVSGAVATEAKLVGEEVFIVQLNHMRAVMKKKLNPKYQELLDKEAIREMEEFQKRARADGWEPIG
jgi:phage replication initiation protein